MREWKPHTYTFTLTQAATRIKQYPVNGKSERKTTINIYHPAQTLNILPSVAQSSRKASSNPASNDCPSGWTFWHVSFGLRSFLCRRVRTHRFKSAFKWLSPIYNICHHVDKSSFCWSFAWNVAKRVPAVEAAGVGFGVTLLNRSKIWAVNFNVVKWLFWSWDVVQWLVSVCVCLINPLDIFNVFVS